MDETPTPASTTYREPRVFALEQDGYLTGPFTARPQPGRYQTVHEVTGFVHPFDHSRDWFECPWCHSEVTGADLERLERGHECDETTLDR